MHNLNVTRAALLRIVLVAAVSVTLGGAPAAGRDGAQRAAPVLPGPLLGLIGQPERFKDQTGQETQVRQAFLGWGQGLSFGSTFAGLLPTLAPIPMLHLGTGGRNRAETVTPQDIAQGKGDAYLVAMNQAIARWGKGIYVRPMAEMNNAGNFYSAYNSNGSPKGESHSTANYRKAFARVYVILHGGTTDSVNAKLRQLGLPGVSGELFPNPFPTLRIVWSPLAGGNPRVAGNASEAYYPGAQYVDVEGADIYAENPGDTAPWGAFEELFQNAHKRGKPWSIPEWGLFTIDDPAFVQHVCSFLKSHKTTEVQIFYESNPGSIFDLGNKPKSADVYRNCIVPLGTDYPDWAAANAPGGGARVLALKLTPRPASGGSPLSVQFAVDARLSVPIQRWTLLFGDGTEQGGAG